MKYITEDEFANVIMVLDTDDNIAYCNVYGPSIRYDWVFEAVHHYWNLQNATERICVIRQDYLEAQLSPQKCGE